MHITLNARKNFDRGDKLMNRFKGTKGEATEGYEICNKQDIQKALVEKNSGKCRAYSTTYYGDVMIVSTVIAGNLILQNGFYPIAYVRPETGQAVINDEEHENPNSQFAKLQSLIKEACEIIATCKNASELIEYINTNQNYGL